MIFETTKNGQILGPNNKFDKGKSAKNGPKIMFWGFRGSGPNILQDYRINLIYFLYICNLAILLLDTFIYLMFDCFVRGVLMG